MSDIRAAEAMYSCLEGGMLSEVTSTKGKWVLVWLRFPERYRGQ
jgi:hypothetical protein